MGGSCGGSTATVGATGGTTGGSVSTGGVTGGSSSGITPAVGAGGSTDGCSSGGGVSCLARNAFTTPAGPPNKAPPKPPNAVAAPTPFNKSVSGNTSWIPTCLANAPPPSSMASDPISPTVLFRNPAVPGIPLPTNARSIAVPPGNLDDAMLSPAASIAATRPLDNAIPWASSSGTPCSLNCL